MVCSDYEKHTVDGFATSPVADSDNAPDDDFLTAVKGFSIEIGASELESLTRSAHLLPENTEVFLNVLPRDGIEERIRLCKQVKSIGLRPVPHIAARKLAEKHEVQQTLDKFMQQAGATDFLIVAGDYSQPAGEIADAVEFIQLIKPGDSRVRRIGITGYPEGHPEITEAKLDEALKDKITVLRSLGIEPFVVTQFSFNADAIVGWCKRLHSRYPDIQIKVGVPGPAKLTTLIRFAQRCGVRSSMKKLKGLPVSSSLKLMQRVPPLNQALAVGNYKNEQNDNATIHLFTFGGLEASLEWIRSEVSARITGGEQ